MIFDEAGLPRDTGATDYNDSARLAGMMVLFQHDKAPNLEQYVINSKYVRHPKESRYDFSRDQAVCLMAGLWAQGRADLVDEGHIQGKDFLSPSVKGHIRRCKGLQATFMQNLWLRMDVLYNAYISPMAEPNQLLCMLMVAGPEYVCFWKKHNTRWEAAITEYWRGWREEDEFGYSIIEQLRGY